MSRISTEGDGLTPLPTTFDPDAMSFHTPDEPTKDVNLSEEIRGSTIDVTSPDRGGDSQAGVDGQAEPVVEIQSQADKVESENANGNIQNNESSQQVETAQEDAAQEPQDVDMEDQVDAGRPEVNQDLLGLLQSLHGTGAEEEEGEEEMEEEAIETVEVQGEEEEQEPPETGKLIFTSSRLLPNHQLYLHLYPTYLIYLVNYLPPLTHLHLLLFHPESPPHRPPHPPTRKTAKMVQP